QRALGGSALAGQEGEALTEVAVRPLAEAAIARWADAGLDSAGLAALRNVAVHVSDLPDDLLGLSNAHVVFLDVNAAGWGWFLDPTPADDTEFTGAGGPAAGHIDLLS